MSRRVYSSADLASLKKTIKASDTATLGLTGEKAPAVAEQDWNQKIISYIPVEIVAVWTAIYGVLNTMDSVAFYWLVFIALGILVPIYIWRCTDEPDLPPAYYQIAGATGAFVVWVFAMGGPFTKIPWFVYDPAYGTVVLALYSVVLAILLKKKPAAA